LPSFPPLISGGPIEAIAASTRVSITRCFRR